MENGVEKADHDRWTDTNTNVYKPRVGNYVSLNCLYLAELIHGSERLNNMS